MNNAVKTFYKCNMYGEVLSTNIPCPLSSEIQSVKTCFEHLFPEFPNIYLSRCYISFGTLWTKGVRQYVHKIILRNEQNSKIQIKACHVLARSRGGREITKMDSRKTNDGGVTKCTVSG
jgi:hypothetical protein